ncbi:exocyst complex subunit Sec15-like-domain-containing protein [Entophlyctis helioformis]|nr:exocyst complex subunit Sec15-like-domain-containing protein [Entophlyctis helioformis]
MAASLGGAVSSSMMALNSTGGESLTREEIAHMQQLIRDLVQGDANLPSANSGAGGGSIGAGSMAGTSMGGPSMGGGGGMAGTGMGTGGVGAGSSGDSPDGFDQIPYIIKQIFQTGREDAFGEQLSIYCSRKVAEIERMCNIHYQEFVQSVDQLLKVRAGTATMRDKIKAMNEELQVSGRKIAEQKADVIESRRTLLNVETALESMQACLFVLDIANRVGLQVGHKKYYSALRMLDELQSEHLAHIAQFSFSRQIHEWIPFMQNQIREAVVEELNQWFVTVRESTDVVGRLAMELTVLRQDRATEILASSRSLNKAGHSINVGTSMEMAINEEYDMDALDSNEVHLEFTPLFQCIHIHDVLGKRSQFKAEYEENRRLQSEVIIGTVFSLRDGDLSGFERYIQQIAGFFVIEATVISSTLDFRSRSSVETLWESAVNKMNTHISECLRDCVDPDLFLKIKICVVAFIQTMGIYGFSVTSLTDLMVSLLDRFADLKKSQCAERLIKIIDEEDDYMPMIVNNPDELDEVNGAFTVPLEQLKSPSKLSRGVDAIVFPKMLPFSKGFFRCCQCIHEFIRGFYRFAEGFEQQSNEMDDLLKKCLDNLLVQNLNGALLRKMSTSGLSIVIQIMVNSQWYEKACHQFEELLQEQRHAYKGVRVVLLASMCFEETRTAAEKRIYEVINTKIDSFMEVTEYDWEATAAVNRPSAYLTDLVDYLTTVVSSTLAGLPNTTKAYVYFEAFDHLTASLKNMLLDPQIKRITIPVLHTLDVDVGYLESFVKQLNDTNAGDAFTELRQLINYGKSESYEDILTQSIRNKKYSRVNINDAVILLEKLKNFDTSYFSKSTAAEKQLKKDIENALRLIRK